MVLIDCIKIAELARMTEKKQKEAAEQVEQMEKHISRLKYESVPEDMYLKLRKKISVLSEYTQYLRLVSAALRRVCECYCTCERNIVSGFDDVSYGIKQGTVSDNDLADMADSAYDIKFI
ncbi:MAG: hypothetical protein ACI4I9_07970 [Porcipelethomonas sp.]